MFHVKHLEKGRKLTDSYGFHRWRKIGGKRCAAFGIKAITEARSFSTICEKLVENGTALFF